MKHSTIRSFNTLTTIAFAITLAVLGSWFLYNVSLVSNPNIASAGPNENLSGWAWSSGGLWKDIGNSVVNCDVNSDGAPDNASCSGATLSGVGWISFNCTDKGTCGLPNYANYGVHIEESNKFKEAPNAVNSIKGYAWVGNCDDKDNDGNVCETDELDFDNNGNGIYEPSDGDTYNDIDGDGRYDSTEALTFGWINFAPGGPYPAAPNYSSQIDWGGPTPGVITGWAKMISGGGANAGKWDGWIKLNPTGNGSYDVRLNSSNNIVGSAWNGEFNDKNNNGIPELGPNPEDNEFNDANNNGVLDNNEMYGLGWIDFSAGGLGNGVKFTPGLIAQPGVCGQANGSITATKPANPTLCEDMSVPGFPNDVQPSTSKPYKWNWSCDGGVTQCNASFPQCSDGVDNDGDGNIDYDGGDGPGGNPGDSGCSGGQADPSERSFQFREF